MVEKMLEATIIKPRQSYFSSLVVLVYRKEVSMDFITGLPKLEGKNFIMVVVDRLTKYACFCALSHTFKEIIVDAIFMETFQKVHGNLNIILSDRDPIFTSKY